MMTATEMRYQKWLERILDCKASDLTVGEWCKQHDVSEKQYWYYHRRLSDRLAQEVSASLPTVTAPTFCELKQPQISQPSVTNGNVHLHVGNHTIDIDDSVSDEFLERIIKAVCNA